MLNKIVLRCKATIWNHNYYDVIKLRYFCIQKALVDFSFEEQLSSLYVWLDRRIFKSIQLLQPCSSLWAVLNMINRTQYIWHMSQNSQIFFGEGERVIWTYFLQRWRNLHVEFFPELRVHAALLCPITALEILDPSLLRWHCCLMNTDKYKWSTAHTYVTAAACGTECSSE